MNAYYVVDTENEFTVNSPYSNKEEEEEADQEAADICGTVETPESWTRYMLVGTSGPARWVSGHASMQNLPRDAENVKTIRFEPGEYLLIFNT